MLTGTSVEFALVVEKPAAKGLAMALGIGGGLMSKAVVTCTTVHIIPPGCAPSGDGRGKINWRSTPAT